MAVISLPQLESLAPAQEAGDAETSRQLLRVAHQPTPRRIDRSFRYRLLLADLTGLFVAGTAWAALGKPALGAAIGVVVSVLLFRSASLYAHQTTPSVLDQCWRVLMSTVLAGLAAHTALGGRARNAVAYGVLAGVAVLVARAIAHRSERRRVIAQPRRVLIAGMGSAGSEFADRLLRHPEYGMTPVAFLDAGDQPLDPDLEIPVVHGLEKLSQLSEDYAVDRIVIDAEVVPEDLVYGVLDGAADAGIEVGVLPVLTRQLSTAVHVEGVAGMTLLSYRRRPVHGVAWRAKRALDVLGAAVALALSLPLLVGAALAIKLGSSGPVLFSQERVGRAGRRFNLLKLRTMVVDAETRLDEVSHLNEAHGPYFKVANDPRITRVGKLLRRFSIDELPQLINVLRGEMSLVGPRPALPSEVDQFPEWFQRRVRVTPGLTGLWQVSGRFMVPMHEAARLDVFYADHWSLGLDLKILARTPAVVLSGKGAR